MTKKHRVHSQFVVFLHWNGIITASYDKMLQGKLKRKRNRCKLTRVVGLPYLLVNRPLEDEELASENISN